MKSKSKQIDSGFGLMEGLATIALTAVLLTMVATQFVDITKKTFDQRIRMAAEEEARLLLDILAFDMRMIGAGMPIGQSNFVASEPSLGDAPLPVLTTSTATSITFRLNDRGVNSYLTNEYTPDLASLTFDVHDSSSFIVGDTIYLSDMYVGESDGLKGIISGISGSQIAIKNTYITMPGAIFPAGSTIHKISEITLTGSGPTVTRSLNGGTTVLMQPNATFTLDYQDSAGSSVPLPLNSTEISSELKGIAITVNVNGAHALHDGSVFTATASEKIVLRNLVEQ